MFVVVNMLKIIMVTMMKIKQPKRQNLENDDDDNLPQLNWKTEIECQFVINNSWVSICQYQYKDGSPVHYSFNTTRGLSLNCLNTA